MRKKIYFLIEETSEDGTSTQKKINMNIFEKLFNKLFSNHIGKVTDDLQTIKGKLEIDVKGELLKLNGQQQDLKSKLNDIEKELKKLDDNLQKCISVYNTQKAGSSAKYKDAIDILYQLNYSFLQNVSAFGKEKKIDILQMLIKYLYKPDDNVKRNILRLSNNFNKVDIILNKIDGFNESFKPDLLNYLSGFNKKWEDCVIYPNDNVYNPQTMAPLNDIEIENGEPIYIVSLGYDFPNSNSKKVLPTVVRRLT